MKLLFDNNLSVKLPQLLQAHFPHSKHVFDLNISHFSDHEIWEFAAKNNFSILSKDKDFYYLSNTFGSPPKVIWLTLGNCRNKEVVDLLLNNSGEIKNFLLSSKDILLLG